jgi:phosphatidate cytidylyltransferase
MKKRILMFCIALPLTVFIVLFLPHKNHLVANIIVILLSALGAMEFADILGKKKIPISPVEAAILGALGPIAMTISVSFECTVQLLPVVYSIGAAWILLSRVFLKSEQLVNAASYSAAGFSVMVYPGLFMSWIIRMSLFPQAGTVILIFLLTVIANDSVAWAAGMLLGKGNRGIIPASPNKSAAGFIGGFIASVLVSLGAVVFVPTVFISSSRLPPVAAGIIIGILTGVAAALGDLAESALKRSADMKDSGSWVPGRGGILDSIDSIALAAPVFYILYRILF